MATVDPDDDSIIRYVVRHYRFDPERNERRHVVLTAFDNEAEFIARIKAENTAIERRRAHGDEVHPTEHVSGVALEPGYRRHADNGHLLKRAIAHGVSAGAWLDDLELPGNTAILRSESPETP